MKTFVAYALALAAAHIGGLVGILTTAATMRRLRSPPPEISWYALDIAPGLMGHTQRAFISFGRAAVALVMARAVLSLFGLQLCLWFAGLVTACMFVWDLWGVHVAGCADGPLGMSGERARVARATARVAVPPRCS